MKKLTQLSYWSRNFLLGVALLFCYQIVYGQHAISESISKNMLEIQQADSYNPFREVASNKLKTQIPETILGKKWIFELEKASLESIKEKKDKYLKISMSVGEEVRELQLVEAEIFTADFSIATASTSDVELDIDTGIHYWGTVKGIPNSLVALSFFDNEIVGSVSLNNQQYTVGKVKNNNYHIIYEKNDLDYNPGFECHTFDDGIQTTDTNPTEKSSLLNCVRIHIEADYSLYLDKGASIANTIEYVSGLFNQVATLYANESIIVKLSFLHIWDIPAPFQTDSGNSSTILQALRAQNYGTTNGDLVHLLHREGGGGRAYINSLCNPNRNMGVNGVASTFRNVPLYSWSVEVFTHEIGHNLGSRHTHDCVWNGNGTQIDDCGNKYFDEDGDDDSNPQPCYDSNNQIIPSNGGTIMSYCHLNPVRIKFNLGFGQQPGDLIRSRVSNASCLNVCSNIVCPPDATVSCASNIIPGVPNFQTGCASGSNVTTTGPIISGTPNCPNTTYTYTFTGTDDCGAEETCTQTFTIQNDAPTITCPPDINVSCVSEIIIGIASFNTSCQVGGSVAVSGPVVNGLPNCDGTTYTFTFTGTDGCNRIAQCQRTFTIQNDAPTITCQPDMTVTCQAKILVGTANFNTSCQLGGSVAITGPVVDGDLSCDGTTYTYTFTGTDACGRIAECQRVFTISNNGPTITCPPSEIVTCENEIIVGDLPVYNTDCFIGANLSRTGPFLDGLPNCGGTNYTYTYTVVDACGRETSCDQVFTIENAPPTITCPADSIVECFADISVDAADASFTTSCDLVATVTVSDPVVVGTPDCPGTTYTYTYAVQDECGRIATCDQVFTIDNAAPTITCPADATVECFADISVDAADASFTVSCDLVANVTVSDAVIVGDPDCPGTTYTYTYTVTDACDRIATCDQVFTIENEGPTITCPADAIVQCASNIFVDVNNATFTTSCDLGGVLSLSDAVIVGDPDCPGTTHTYTYTITDDCGRTASCDQVFTIANDGPMITFCPEGCPVACASDIRLGTPEFTTSCSLGGTLSLTGPVIDGDPGCNGTTYTYTHIVTDDCGRTATCDQVFTIVNECHLIDFDFDDEGNPLAPGTDMFDQYDDFTITTENPHRCAQLFDTGHPTSNDFDLGTPNEQYGGPGIGAGGANNTEFQGNALIVSKDCGVPNETEGQLIFDFACSVTIKSVDLLDMKCGESEVELYDEHGNQIGYLDIPAYGVNSFNTFDVNISGVYQMIVDLDCGGGVTGFKYCKDNAPGTDCEAPDLCEDYNLDFDNSGYHWTTNSTSGSFDVGNQNYTISIADDDNILEDTYEHSGGLTIGINPHDVHDEVVVCYNLSQISDNVSFDIHDLDRKNYWSSRQQEAVCVYGLLGDDLTQILPAVTSLNGHVDVDGNCAEATTDSAHSHDDESVSVEFSECIDKVVIVYGTGSNSPTTNPSYSKITIGKRFGFNSEVCPGDCIDCTDGVTGGGDDDGDGVCNIDDVCPGGNDNLDRDGDGIPDACDDICYDYNIDHDGCGAAWGHNDTSGNVELGNDNIDISIIDNDNIFVDSQADGAGLQVGIDPHNVNDELVVCYNLSKSSSNVVFDITDLDLKNGNSKQQEKACIFGTLGANSTPILPTVTSLDGHVNIVDNCGEATTNSAISHDDESILVEFTECIDKITIVYGTGSQSPTNNPSYSKITIGASVFTVEQCKDGCEEPCTAVGSSDGDADDDGVCDTEDVCPGFDDNIDTDGDGIPDGCDGTPKEDEQSNANISLYPNPVYGSGSVTIEIDTEARGDAQVVLIDALGRTVSSENIQLMNDLTIHQFSTKQLAAGVYFVQLQTNEWRTNAMKLVVVKP